MERALNTYIHPGFTLKDEVIEAHNLNIGQAALLLDVSRLTLSKITNGRGAITPNIALRIESVFGGNADLWLRMQSGYDLAQEKLKFSKNPPNVHRFVQPSV